MLNLVANHQIRIILATIHVLLHGFEMFNPFDIKCAKKIMIDGLANKGFQNKWYALKFWNGSEVLLPHNDSLSVGGQNGAFLVGSDQF